uniref:GH16 domain-containing protein n=1 Tax=Acrobeloides nanus TaxID=290746 RepID=A0A914D821_9BILA
MPTGPGTWPSFWMYGDDWPNNGELDVLEGIDVSDDDLFTGHWAKNFNGSLATNCFSHADDLASMQGCSIQAANGTFGPAFNQNNGGIYAMEWNRSSYTKVWIFKRSDIPNDIIQVYHLPVLI